MPTPWDYTQGGLYQDFQFENDYTLVEGVFALPVAEDPPTDAEELAEWSPVVLVRAHSPYRLRNVDFRVKKTGNPPVIPKPTDHGSFGFLGGLVAFAHPSFNLSLGRYDWTVGGNYTFVEDCRSSPDDGFVLGGGSFGLTSQQHNAQYLPEATPQFGAVANAGSDARRGYSQGQQISLDYPGWVYDTVTYFPATLLNEEQLNGTTYLPTG